MNEVSFSFGLRSGFFFAGKIKKKYNARAPHFPPPTLVVVTDGFLKPFTWPTVSIRSSFGRNAFLPRRYPQTVSRNKDHRRLGPRRSPSRVRNAFCYRRPFFEKKNFLRETRVKTIDVIIRRRPRPLRSSPSLLTPLDTARGTNGHCSGNAL